MPGCTHSSSLDALAYMEATAAARLCSIASTAPPQAIPSTPEEALSHNKLLSLPPLSTRVVSLAAA